MQYLFKSGIRAVSHRQRIKLSKRLVEKYLKGGEWLDYGCGDGRLMSCFPLSTRMVGYEPFMDIESGPLVITAELPGKRFDLISAFEVFEHLDDGEEIAFLDYAKAILSGDGVILISVPIEYGPIWFLKYFLRFLTRLRLTGAERECAEMDPKLSIKQILRCGILGESPPRTEYRNMSHLGFDARKVPAFFEREGWVLVDKFHSPFKFLPKSFNSQLFCVFQREETIVSA